ncbi:MAG: hypothetical protein U1E93_11330 [Alphaproteobacteria bacterium]
MRHYLWFVVPALLVLAAPASARPRDDALTGAIRCGVVADSRQWLDCYYGAAQPVRAALGMAPALAAQVKLASAPPAGGVPRDEAVRDEVISAAAGCTRNSADRAWLDCFYAAANPMRVQLGLRRPSLRLVPRPSPRRVRRRRYPCRSRNMRPPRRRSCPPPGPPPMPRERGMFAGLISSAKPIVKNMPMQSYDIDKKDNHFTVTLIDGQVWEQNNEDAVYHPARWRKDAAEMEVTITPDAMRVYLMTIKGDGKIYKVKRIH